MIQRLRRWWERLQMETLEPLGAPAPLELSFCDRSRDVSLAIARAFAGVDGVEVLCGDLFALSRDALVSPANSFGDMDGGIDKAIDAHFERRAQPAVKQAIATRYLGELPVGAALVVPIASRCYQQLIVAPTMRVPGSVAGSVNAYLALRAALIAAGQHGITSLAIPGLCTGVGRMPYDEAAAQLRAAYDSVIGELWRQVVHASLAPFVMRDAK